MNFTTACRQALGAALLAISAVTITPATAGTVLLDFEGLPQNSLATANFSYNGARISPNCHLHVENTAIEGATGNWLGADSSGCDNLYNSNWLGPVDLAGPRDIYSRGSVYLDFHGAAFSLLQGNIAGPSYAVEIFSSAGGHYVSSSGVDSFDFAALSEWTNLEWILVLGSTGGPAGVDNLLFAVPEPGTAALGGIGLAALLMRRRWI